MSTFSAKTFGLGFPYRFLRWLCRRAFKIGLQLSFNLVQRAAADASAVLVGID